MKDTKWGNEYRLTTVCIDSYENGELTGRFYNPHLDEGRSFRSLIQFLKEMEDLLDDMNFPQSFTAARSFSLPAEQNRGSPPHEQIHCGKLATFAVRVIFRQNASWQGSVTWLDQSKELSFRSVLELILLLDSALS
ncbi:MAG: hypothetical protein IJN72_00010 [Firmicutes bacterium]|nr:hypothetical protein [Bacillota bacterium]MBR3706748.1 hypothetical protein [Bacillota bacterium]MBR6584498.1 hypothetical protein [Bacillota bacterium]